MMVNAHSPTADFNTVQVRYRYVGWDASIIGGTLTFTPSVTRAVDTAVKTTIIARSITGTIGSDGTGSVLLPAGDDPDITVRFTYQVTENFAGGQSYKISVPIAAEDVGIDLALLVDDGSGVFVPPNDIALDTDGAPFVIGNGHQIGIDTDGVPYFIAVGGVIALDTDGTPYLIGA